MSETSQTAKQTAPVDEKKDSAKPELKDEIVESQHTVVIAGQEIAYTATAGRIVMKTEDGKPKATDLLHRLHQSRASPTAPIRPLTILLQRRARLIVGLAAPGRARPAARAFWTMPASILRPPYQMVDNDLLDARCAATSSSSTRSAPATVAPVAGRRRPSSFTAWSKDVESVGEFIRLYTTRYRRWLSPKFLIGESYGTTRAASLSRLSAGRATACI
jgi:hypothetical protein